MKLSVTATAALLLFGSGKILAAGESFDDIGWEDLSAIKIDSDFDSTVKRWNANMDLSGASAYSQSPLEETQHSALNEFQLRSGVGWADKLSSRLRGRFEFGMSYLESGEADAIVAEEPEVEFSLGQTYLEFADQRGFSVRLGNLVVPFGTAEAFKVLDNFNAKDDRMWALEDSAYSTVATPGLQLIYAEGQVRSQLAFSAAFVGDKVSGEGSDFDPFKADRPFAPIDDDSEVESFNPEWMLSITWLGQGVDVGVVAGEIYDKSPVLTGLGLSETGLALGVQHQRSSMFGLSGALVKGNWLLRSDLGWFDKRSVFLDSYFQSVGQNPDTAASNMDSREIQSTTGIEYMGISNTQLSLEYNYTELLDWQEGARGDKVNHAVAMNVQTSLMAEKMDVTGRYIVLANDAGRIALLSADYKINDMTKIGLQWATYSASDESSFFYPYRENDRLLLKLKISL